MLEPKSVPIKTQSGEEKTFVISKFPAVAGREIISKYPLSNVPKLGDYAISEETMLKLMAYVGVETAPGQTLPLSTRALVDNHVPDWETLARIEFEMLRYNCSFFSQGLNSDFFASIAPKLQQWISQISTALLAQSSPTEKQPFTS